VLLRVGLADGSVYSFEYNTYAQVKTIRRYAPNNSNPVNFPGDYFQRAYTTYGLPDNATNPQMDCPRATSRTDWASDWNSGVTSTYAADPGHSWSQVTLPDGTIYKEFFATTGWQRGLTTLTENWSGGVRKKATTLDWTQDNTAIAYQLNPRVTETNVYDDAGNRRRTTMSYTSFGLPSDVYEYDANATTVLRHTHTDYNLSAVYTDRRIIGLPNAQFLYDGANTLFSKVDYQYDLGGTFQVHQGPPVQHDTANYGSGFVQGRGNLNKMRRWDVTPPLTDASPASEYETGYNTSGSVIFTRDPLDHQTSVSYADSFSDGQNNRNTYAYPTTMTDPDNFSSTVQYNFDFGAVTRTQDPKLAVMTRTYDAAGRAERVRNEVNGAYTRYVYAPNQSYVQSFTTINDLNPANEFYSITVFDGNDRVRATASDHPTSVGQYKAKYNLYDVMGRLAQQSNPTEINGSWQPAGDDAAGWVWSYQDYDWKGRPTVSTNQDGTTNEILYGGCGCAGGQVVVTRDEVGRRQKMTYDILGRLKTTQVLFIQPKDQPLDGNGNVYSTTTNSYNVRDQVTNANVRDDASGVSQNTQMVYDGHGRLKQRWLPIYQGNPQSATPYDSYEYNGDDTLMKVTDPRGASATYIYNNRRLVTSITYGVPSGVAATSNVTFGYDEAGNRTSMANNVVTKTYSYNQLSQMTSETHLFSDLTQTYMLSYEYNLAGHIKKVTDPWNASFSYDFNKAGEITDVTGVGYADINGFGSGYTNRIVSQFVTGAKYRAWGATKSFTNGNFTEPVKKNFSMNYNTRLQLAHFDAGGRISDYTYYDDGRIKDVIDSTYNNFNRAHNYDHDGRLIGARAGTVAPKPYDFAYTYDAWGNNTSRTGSYWTCSLSSFTASYTNNRNNNMSYDTAGNVTRPGTQITDATMQYDAAGRQAAVHDYDILSQSFWDKTHGYDGDGQPVRFVTGQEGDSSPYRLHYVRSSVLNGVVISVVSSNRYFSEVKSTSYVYFHGEMIAYQQYGGGISREVVWVYRNPVLRDRYEHNRLDYNGAVLDTVWLETAADPVGAAVATTDPCVPPAPPTPPEPSASTPSEFGSVPDYAGTCVVDGIEGPCDEALRLVNSGVAFVDSGRSNLAALVSFGIFPVPELMYQPGENGDRGQLTLGYRFAFFGFQAQQRPNPNNSGRGGSSDRNVPPGTIGGNNHPCETLARYAQAMANNSITLSGGVANRSALEAFDEAMSELYVGIRIDTIQHALDASNGANANGPIVGSSVITEQHGWGQRDFKDKFQEPDANGVIMPTEDQTHHAVAYMSAGINNMWLAAEVASLTDDNIPDKRLAGQAFQMGANLRYKPEKLRTIGNDIRRLLCKPVP
jgi:YD repeat-containing protein